MSLSKVFRIPFFPAAMAGLAAMGLGLQSCQTPDGPSGPGRNGLSTALAITQPKFGDAVHASGYNTPMSMEFGPDGALYVLEKSGTIKRTIAGSTTTFLTLSVDQNTERGLLGLAFDPNYGADRYVYVHYSVNGGNRNRISKFQVNTANPPQAVAGSEQNLFDLSILATSAYHNGGALHFGKDGYLYATTGDNRNPVSAQNMTSLLGKILRISKAYSGTPGTPNIPTDNPFYGTATGVYRAIWGLGVRNPFTFAFQPGTGRLFLNDVGEQSYEEINEATQGGLNFGWPNSEGPTGQAGVNGPIGGYVNGYAANGNQYNVGDCAVIGAAFYNPAIQQFPSNYLGRYFYGDHCSKYIKSIDPAAPASPSTFATDVAGLLMDLKVGPDGFLYYLTLNGIVGKINYTGTEAPTISQQPASQAVSVGQPVTFSVQANGGGLSYQWKRGTANVGTNATTYTFTPTLADNGATFHVIVTNPFGSATSATATLSVISNQPPAPVISTPAAGTKFNAGTTVNFSGSASDPEDGALSAAALTWKVELVHGTHTHPAFGPVSGVSSGSFTIPAVNETAADIAYRVTLTAKDSKGLTTTVTRDITPNTITLTITTNPAGMTFNLDGQPKTGPQSFTAVVGIQRNLAAVSQTFNGQAYTFTSWSDNGASTHDILTPGANATITVNYGTVGGSNPVPGTIQAENYKTGGENVGYHDADAGNTGGQFRADGVDIEATTDVGLGYNVGWTAAGEWLDYSVNVAAAGNYNLTLRMASGAAGAKTATLFLDGVNKGAFNTSDATGWQSWKDVSLNGINFPSVGAHTLRIFMTTGNFNINWLKLVSTGVTPNQPPVANAGPDKSAGVNTLVTLSGSGSDPENAVLSYSWTKLSGPAATLSNANAAQPTFTPATAGTYVFRLTVSDGALSATDDMTVTATSGTVYINLPGRIQAEDYQPGGENVGYHDLTAGNTGNVYKTDGVDIQATTDPNGGAYNVGWTEAGEWLDFDVNIAAAGTYTLTARVASGNAGTKTMAFSVEGGPETLISFTNASGWQSWTNVVVTGVNIPVSGAKYVRVRMVTGGINFNYLDIAAGGSPNLLLNGDFATGITSWNTYNNAPAVSTIANEAGTARATITNAGANEYDIQLWQAVNLVAGKTYTIDFDIKAEATPKVFKVVVENNGLWTKYQDKPLTVTVAANTWQHFNWTWTQGVADANGRLVFDFGAQNVNDVWIDNVVLK